MKTSRGCCVICGDKNHSSKCLDNNTESVKTINKFVQQLGQPNIIFTKSGEFRLCEECLSGVDKAVGWRDEVDNVERDVRSLQRIILKMMRQLKSLQYNYLEEMYALERKIRKSESKRAEETSRCTTQARDAIKQGIFDVVMDLGNFHRGFLFTEKYDATTPQVKNCRSPTTKLHANAVPEIPSISPEKQNDSDGVVEAILFQMKANCVQNQQPNKHSSLQEKESKGPSLPAVRVPAAPKYSTFQKTCTSKVKAKRADPCCKYCGKTFTDNYNLSRHIYTHTGERPYQCHECPMAFRESCVLKRHMLIHSGKKPFKCLQCKKAFSRKDQLKRHRNVHSGEKRFPCSVCGQRFAEKKNVTRHFKRKHSSNNTKVN